MKKIFASASAAALLTGCLGQNALFDTSSPAHLPPPC